MVIRVIFVILAAYVLAAFIATCDAGASPASQTTAYAQSYADWRIRENNPLPDPVYADLVNVAEAAHWNREVIVVCRRARCRVTVTVWDSRTGTGERSRFTMTTIRRRVWRGVAEFTRLSSHGDWTDIHPIITTGR